MVVKPFNCCSLLKNLYIFLTICAFLGDLAVDVSRWWKVLSTVWKMSQSLVEEWICFSLLTLLFNLLEVQKVIVYLLIIFESCQQNEEHVYGYMLMLKKISVICI
jgi:hypothetical protein